MDPTTVLFSHIHQLGCGLDLDGNGTDDGGLEASLAAFGADLQAAVSSYLGVQLTIVQDGHPVILTAISTDDPARTSLRLPLVLVDPRSDPESRLTVYAATPGAFVDLASDLCYLLGDDRQITLDVDLPPSPMSSGVVGLYELSTINRAVGVLIGRGHHPDNAVETLRRAAACEGLELHHYSARLLRRPSPGGPGLLTGP